MNWKKVILISGILVTAIGISGCKHPFHHGSSKDRFEWVANELVDYLDMDESQEKKVFAMADDIVPVSNELRDTRLEMLQVLSQNLKKDKLDKKQLESILSRQLKAEEKLDMIILEKIEELHYILTDEQKARLSQKLEGFMTHIDSRAQ